MASCKKKLLAIIHQNTLSILKLKSVNSETDRGAEKMLFREITSNPFSKKIPVQLLIMKQKYFDGGKEEL